ncbi:zinc finger protein 182-like isoform X1 [Dicentrarchus labrax]|uniref:zinc finger protein 182-like isoform X1 n=1 Tax=Dicentrarchus labrax TaxID=13489 RepID=UPI0021F5CB3A|nr:zinc finger protein 182-like isoform X1 [Dicentrarchus labrax]
MTLGRYCIFSKGWHTNTVHTAWQTESEQSGSRMANAPLQSFNVFLTERLTAAAMDIYGFVEKTIIEYQEEVYRTKLENQRLQRLLDLVYKPEIRLHRADSRQIDFPTPTQKVCAQEQKIQKESIPSEADEESVILPVKEKLTEPWTRSVETPVGPEYSSITDTLTQTITVGEHEENEIPDDLTQIVKVGEHGDYEAPDSLTRVVTVGEQLQYETPSQHEQPLPSFGLSPIYTKKKNMFFCNICCQPFVKKVELKSHLAAHATQSSPKSSNKAFTCFVCGRRTGTRSQMICHMRTHTGEKPFGCPICGNRYKLKGHIKEHMRTHTGERPYACYICGRSFNRSSTMSKHARIKHREYMPFKCMQCSQRFPLLVVLKRHMKTAHDVISSV